MACKSSNLAGENKVQNARPRHHDGSPFEQWMREGERIQQQAELDRIRRGYIKHRCRACRDVFFTTKGRDRFCESCRLIIGTEVCAFEELLLAEGRRFLSTEKLLCRVCGESLSLADSP